MDIKQKIEDNGRVQKDSRDKLKHWKRRHEELQLTYIEYVLHPRPRVLFDLP